MAQKSGCFPRCIWIIINAGTVKLKAPASVALFATALSFECLIPLAAKEPQPPTRSPFPADG